MRSRTTASQSRCSADVSSARSRALSLSLDPPRFLAGVVCPGLVISGALGRAVTAGRLRLARVVLVVTVGGRVVRLA